ncbi:MAG: NYN domain-containing protein [Candidatus Latescibacteria bacterium]|nr:NYN domain-containing protein [Candidatus Latescibacterota bacterium]
MFEEIGREVHTLRVETKRLQEPEARVVKPYGEDARVGVFVDVQNVFYAARQFNARVDFEKLLEATVGKRRLIKAIAYVVQSPDVDQTSFVSMLQQKNYEVKRKDLRLRSDGSAKGDWDMGMAIDMIGLADKLDVVVIVSGDGDFVSLVHLIKTMGPKVEVFSFVHNTARDLVQAADSYYSIDEGLLLKMTNHGNDRTEKEAEE